MSSTVIDITMISYGIRVFHTARVFVFLLGLTVSSVNSFTSDRDRLTTGLKLDPDANRNLTQLITSLGYPVETYVVQTRDGFLLDLHHIPSGRKHTTTSATKANPQNNNNNNSNNNNSNNNNNNNSNNSQRSSHPSTEEANYSKFLTGEPNNYASDKTSSRINHTRPAVFLQHGYMSSACDFVMNFANDSLAFILADAGYDVWLGNSRGNTYSRRHSNLNPNQDEFWDWSFDEMAEYDTSAFIDFIINKTTQPSVYYIGHSQGTMVALALLSRQPEYQKKIRLFVGLAPIISLAHMKSPMKYLAYVNESLLYDLLGRQECSANTMMTKLFADTVCAHPATRWVCDNLLFLTNGPDLSNLNQTRLPVYMSHTPAGTSVKNVIHYAQMVREKRFAKYDYGTPKKNIERYGQAIPPAYNASKIWVPALLFTASNDWLADPTDVSILESTLPNIRGKYNYPTWNHMDFVLGERAGEMCYSQILKRLPEF